MKIEKSFLICIFLLGVLSLGFVCAEDNSVSDTDAPGEIAAEDSRSDVNKLAASPEDLDSAQSDESNSGDKEDLDSILYMESTVYPWTWADTEDGDRGPRGFQFFWLYEYELTGNTTVYLDDEVLNVYSGDSYVVISPETLWQYYHGKDKHTVKFVYSGDDKYNLTTNAADYYMLTHSCELDGDVVHVNVPSNVSGVLTVKANGRTILTKDIKATYAKYEYYRAETYRFSLEGLDSGVNHIEVIFKCDSDMYSFDESFEYYYDASKDVVPNQTSDGSTFHREVSAGNDSKAVGSVAAGNPLLVLALALSSLVLLPRRK